MPITLKNYTRTVDLSGLSGTASETDPLHVGVSTAGLNKSNSWLTYLDQDGQPGMRIAQSSGKPASFQMTAVPSLWQYHSSGALVTTAATITWSQKLRNGVAGGLWLGDFSGKGRLWLVSHTAAANTVYRFAANSAYATTFIASHTLQGTAGTWVDLRVVLAGVSGGNVSATLQQRQSGVWVTISTDTFVGTYSMRAEWYCSNGGTVDLRGPSGTSGPVVEFQGVDRVLDGRGQSMLAGGAQTNRTSTRPDTMIHRRDGTTVSPAADPYFNATVTPGGSLIPPLLDTLSGSVVATSHGVFGGTAVAQHTPDPSNRFGGLYCGPANSAVTYYAGDGTDVQVDTLWWQGTKDARLGTTAAAYQASLTSIISHCFALRPTSHFWVCAIGDRTYLPTQTPTAAQNQAIRDAQLAAIEATAAKIWFEESLVIGQVGDGTGWADSPDDGTHPGDADYAAILPYAAAPFAAPILTLLDAAPDGLGSGLSLAY